MKKLMIMPAVVLLAGMAVQAQDYSAMNISGTEAGNRSSRELHQAKGVDGQKGKDAVSEISRERFYEDFGNIPADWKRTKYFDEASFTQNGQRQTAYYDSQAKLVGTASELAFTRLPANARHEITSHYVNKGYELGKVVLFNNNEDNIQDIVETGFPFSDSDNYFVEVSKGGKTVLLKVDTDGFVSYFADERG